VKHQKIGVPRIARFASSPYRFLRVSVSPWVQGEGAYSTTCARPAIELNQWVAIEDVRLRRSSESLGRLSL
jgi:hypothetical protein